MQLGQPHNLPDSMPVPDFRRAPLTREGMRKAISALGRDFPPGATREEMEVWMRNNGVSEAMLQANAAPPPPVQYRPAPEPKPRETLNVHGRSIDELRSICRDIDPHFRPPTKSNRNVFLAFLVGKGLVTGLEAFKGAD